MRASGQYDTRLTILRRVAASRPAGNLRSAFAEVATVWARLSIEPGREQVDGGTHSDMAESLVYVRDCHLARHITIADRARVGMTEYAITGLAPADRRGGEIVLRISRQLG